MSGRNPISCDEALRLLAVFLDGELHGEPHDAVEHHLEVCQGCFSRAEFERRLKAEVRRLRQDEVSPSFEDRVHRLLDSFTPAAAEPSDDS
jgi:anti-sigma factor (TIGR02949 family)